jgi:metal-responsive CopG/Arc/MetJ family transcriptional regulator
VVTVEIPKELLAICDNVEDEEARKVCISEISDEFMDAIKKLLEEANALEN